MLPQRLRIDRQMMDPQTIQPHRLALPVALGCVILNLPSGLLRAIPHLLPYHRCLPLLRHAWDLPGLQRMCGGARQDETKRDEH
jgi:hypothetical protein